MSAAFHAMGTDVTVVAPELDPAAEAALGLELAATFAQSERRFSRFLPDSELSQLNRARGPFTASAPMFAALLRARAYFELTSGLFDPAIGGALVALGYDRSFTPGGLDRATTGAAPPRSVFCELELDPATRGVLRPAHMTLDLGGFIKGHAVDRAARRLPANAAVDAGGDAVLRGAGVARTATSTTAALATAVSAKPAGARNRGPGEGWLVDVEDPRDAARTLMTLRVRDRAVATSAPNRRRWRAGGGEQHHLIDPRTGRPAPSDLAQVTVVAATAEIAEVVAKTAFLLGRREGGHFLSRLPGLGGVLVPRDGVPEVRGEVEVVSDV